MTTTCSRRRFLATASAAAGVLVAGRGRTATPPKETGLSHEGLLDGRPDAGKRGVIAAHQRVHDRDLVQRRRLRLRFGGAAGSRQEEQERRPSGDHVARLTPP